MMIIIIILCGVKQILKTPAAYRKKSISVREDFHLIIVCVCGKEIVSNKFILKSKAQFSLKEYTHL